MDSRHASQPRHRHQDREELRAVRQGDAAGPVLLPQQQREQGEDHQVDGQGRHLEPGGEAAGGDAGGRERHDGAGGEPLLRPAHQAAEGRQGWLPLHPRLARAQGRALRHPGQVTLLIPLLSPSFAYSCILFPRYPRYI